MMLIVSGVGMLIVAYSIGYMDGDDEERRYFAYMALFVFSMLLLVQGGNLLMLLVGWGLVGLSSYLLIGFWHQRPEAIAAAKKAFVMNAVGDATMALALFLLIQRTGSLNFEVVVPRRRTRRRSVGDQPRRARPARRRGREVGPAPAPDVAPGRDGRPDAGQRAHPRRDDGDGGRLPDRPHARRSSSRRRRCSSSRAGLGAVTLVMAGLIALVQTDIKRVIAYSTMSQIGYMFLGVGLGAYANGDVPPDDARLLQGAALPRGRARDPRARGRAGHAADGRAAEADAVHVRRLPGRRARARRDPAVLGLLLEGLDPRRGARPRQVRRSSSGSPG